MLERAFSFVPREGSYIIEEVEGEIPIFLRGTYYINGPGRFSRGDLRYRHWLDGDGMIYSVCFRDEQIRFANRFVRSAKYVAESKEGRPVFRAFGTGFESDQLKRRIGLESPINVSVYRYGATLLAFGEQGLPWELDPVTLETRGQYNFGGSLNEVSPFSGHPKFDQRTAELINFGVSFSATEPRLNLYRFDPAGKLLYRRRLPLDYPCSIHDFVLSKGHAVFYLSPYLLNMKRLLSEGRTLMESLRWEPSRGSKLLIVSRESGDEVARIRIGQGYCLHLINSFERNGLVVVDVIEYDRPIYDQYQTVPNLFSDVPYGRAVRFVVNPGSQELVERSEIDYHLAPDFPVVDPSRAMQAAEDFWMLGIAATGQPGRKFFNQLIHAHWGEKRPNDIYQAPSHCYLGGQPAFVGHPHSQDGVIMCQMFDARQSESTFVLFDAFNVAKGPFATLHLREPMPFLFHSSFHRE
jgi:all-trans-8'-apo-beta-carotenal 15,15'-oxygenase